MQFGGYRPYKKPTRFKQRSFVQDSLSLRSKQWLWIVLGGFFTLFFILYLSLGDLRFIMNNYLGLTFFRKHYVVLLQNNYELRPGGGFITGYGEITMTLGFPTHITFDNSYRIETKDYVDPPYPHEKLLKNEWYEGYTFRDANWDPDFPSAVDDLKAFYQQQFPEKKVDGFIVLNFGVLEDLVEILGGVRIGEEVAKGSTLFSLLTHEVNNIDRHDEATLLERKNLLNPLASALIRKAKWHPFKVRRVLEQALEEKELYVWLDSRRLQRKLEKKGWTNSLDAEMEGDFLAVNVANLGAKKADRYLQKELHHFVDLKGPVPRVRTELTFRLPGAVNPYLADYRGYVRLYLPADTEVEELDEGDTVSSETGFTVIAHELNLLVGERKTLAYEYTLPRTLWNGKTYDFHLIKQSGSELFANVVVQISPQQRLESEGLSARENRAMWQGLLKKDESFSLEVQPDVLAPYPIEQEFKNLNTVVVDWNEPLDEAVARDATNYRLEDRNVTHQEVTDEVKVVYVAVEGSRVTLELEGVSEQPLERYTLTFKNLRDVAGNLTDPEPLQVTVVQRYEGMGGTSSAEGE